MSAPRPEDELPSVSHVSLSEPPPPDSSVGGALFPGQLLVERYEVVRPLATGGTATVYLARHSLIDRPVAIKALDPALKHDERVVRRFINEGRAAGALGHPHIIESTDLGYTPDGVPFLVLEYLEGRNLDEEIRSEGPLALGRTLRLAAQIASACGAAHAKGIVHRDLKSENVFLVQKVGQADHVKVLDFGVSKFSTADGATEAGEIYGTADFLSPEQIGATDSVDGRTDVYALGVILYNMLTGHVPFEHIEFPAVLHSIMLDPPPPMSTWRPDIPEPIRALVERCMTKKPDFRFQSMAELESALSGLLETLQPQHSLHPSMGPPNSSRSSMRVRGAQPGLNGGAPLSEEAMLSASSAAITMRESVPGAPPPNASTTRTAANSIAPPSPTKRWAIAAVTAIVVVGVAIGLGRSQAASSAAQGDSTAKTAVPAEVALMVQAGEGATMTFRGREFVLPFNDKVRSSTERERIDVKVSDSERRTVWLVLDEPRRVLLANAAAGSAPSP